MRQRRGLSTLLIAALSFGCRNFLVDGEGSGGDASPSRVDGGQQGEGGDAGDTCSFAPGTTSGAKVRVVYLIPSDRDVDLRYLGNLELAVRDVQHWLRDHTADGISFEVHDPVVEVVRSSHPAAWYSTNPTAGGFAWHFWDNVTADGFSLTGGQFADQDDLWLFYPAADPACDQGGGGAENGVGIFTENDLRGLVGDPRVSSCEGGGSDRYGRCRWVGGMALHLVRALGLAYPAGCIDDDDATTCDWAHLTTGGYLDYPNARLTADDAEFLAATQFFASRSLPDCELDCSAE